MSYQSVNPYNGKLLKKFKELTGQQLEQALKTAATGFETWRCTTFAKRAAVAAKAAAIMRARVDEFARPVTLEMGKLIAEARGEVALSADIIDYYAKNAERFLAPQKLEPSSGEAVIESTPFGGIKDSGLGIALVLVEVAAVLLVRSLGFSREARTLRRGGMFFVRAACPSQRRAFRSLGRAQPRRHPVCPRGRRAHSQAGLRRLHHDLPRRPRDSSPRQRHGRCPYAQPSGSIRSCAPGPACEQQPEVAALAAT